MFRRTGRWGATLQHAIPAVNANVAQAAGFDGRGIGIAVIDSGVNDHFDLTEGTCGKSRVVYRQNFATGDPAAEVTRMRSWPVHPDLYGHGTHVAGILAGSGRCAGENRGLAYLNGIAAPQARFTGVAPAAHIVDLRALNSNGAGTDSTVIQAIDRAIQLRKQYNIRVINLSLGRPVRESYLRDPLCQAVERAWQAGIVVVVAAGNRGRLSEVTDRNGKRYEINGYGTVGSPGNDPFVITVGAMRDMGTPGRADNLIASYSSKGPTGIDRIVKPDLVAPGNRLFSATTWLPGVALTVNCAFPSRDSGAQPGGCTGGTVLHAHFPQNRSQLGVAGSFLEMSGTSMATPMVAGAAALLAQKFGAAITPDAIKAKLMKSASKSFPTRSTFGGQTIQYDLFTVGAGYLDVMGALNNTEAVPAGKPALSPSVVYYVWRGGRHGLCAGFARGELSVFEFGEPDEFMGGPVGVGWFGVVGRQLVVGRQRGLGGFAEHGVQPAVGG
ncbi:MAG: S8 family peptidase [Acidobacteria bacterium]|nr:S8 family peptidase [Acidobacteriota bacterium]